MSYPTGRQTLHAMAYIRGLFAAEIPKRYGADVVTLMAFVATEEYRLFYSVAPAYWFNGMKGALGFGGNDRLIKAIHSAKEAGLLHYEPSQHKPSEYWTLVPEWFIPFYSVPESGMKHSRNRNRTGNDSGNDSGNHSININNEDDIGDFFTQLWSAYPPRNGKKLERQKALSEFKKIKREDWPLVLVAAAELAKSDQLPKDCFRWLRGGAWREWLPVQSVQPVSKQQPAGRGRSLLSDEVQA